MKDESFSKNLDLMDREVSIVIQSFYTYIGIHNYLSSNKVIYEIVNQNPSFWNITLDALKNNFLIALGRIFDKDKRANSIYKLVNTSLVNPQIFSKESLAKRRLGNSDKPKWFDDFLSRAFEPSVNDLTILDEEVSKLRDVYESVYSDIRNKMIAHSELHDPVEISQLFGRTRVGEIEMLLYGLHDLLFVLRELFYNGKKPEFGIQTYDYEETITRTTQNVLNVFQPKGVEKEAT